MKLRVFVSSTGEDLSEHRQKVIDAILRLGHFPVAQEAFGAQPLAPIEACRKAVASCHAVVLVVAHRYGRKPPGESRSFTHLEFDAARKAGKNVLAFLIAPTVPPTDGTDGAGGDASPSPELERFKAELRDLLTVDTFRSADDLAARVTAALSSLAATPPGPPKKPKDKWRRVAWVAGAVSLMGALLILSPPTESLHGPGQGCTRGRVAPDGGSDASASDAGEELEPDAEDATQDVLPDSPGVTESEGSSGVAVVKDPQDPPPTFDVRGSEESLTFTAYEGVELEFEFRRTRGDFDSLQFKFDGPCLVDHTPNCPERCVTFGESREVEGCLNAIDVKKYELAVAGLRSERRGKGSVPERSSKTFLIQVPGPAPILLPRARLLYDLCSGPSSGATGDVEARDGSPILSPFATQRDEHLGRIVLRQGTAPNDTLEIAVRATDRTASPETSQCAVDADCGAGYRCDCRFHVCRRTCADKVSATFREDNQAWHSYNSHECEIKKGTPYRISFEGEPSWSFGSGFYGPWGTEYKSSPVPQAQQGNLKVDKYDCILVSSNRNIGELLVSAGAGRSLFPVKWNMERASGDFQAGETGSLRLLMNDCYSTPRFEWTLDWNCLDPGTTKTFSYEWGPPSDGKIRGPECDPYRDNKGELRFEVYPTSWSCEQREPRAR